MTRIIWLSALVSLTVLLSCSKSHLIEDKTMRRAVTDDYLSRSVTYSAVRPDLFSITDTVSESALREAVTFLLAYMPLSDMAVCEPGYLYENAAAALRTRREMPWGESVPPGIFLNFVLPTRVNNENPDDFRLTCYEELHDRVSRLNAMEAALDINRWCHEKVAYQAADSRTSAPLATMLSARGRCGEESTFTVSALRAAGIPARQVYTPRWAHTDDNHAWVEFWVDGSWHYLGACEPEPVPDRGWFTEPARRAMLVHTKAFGKYDGDEKVIRNDRLFTEINALDRYAETKELTVTVTDGSGTSVPGAMVGYMLYNYAEFYPLARLLCDARGETSLTTGYGSLLIWADDGRRFGFTVAQPEDTLVIVPLSSEMPHGLFSPDLRVPVVPEPLPGIDPEMVQMNNSLNHRGDSIRNAYISSWPDGASAGEIARSAGLPADAVSKILTTSMGNYRAVVDFINSAGEQAGLAFRILGNISEKDLRDTPASVLADHLDNAPAPAPGSDTTLYDRYVLSPRISNELLSPFRSQIKTLPGELIASFIGDPAEAAAWIDTAITLTDSENHYSVPVIPGAVLRMRMADSHSRDIFMVALCRTAGIPARLAPGTGRPQYHGAGEWHDVWFTGESRPSGTPGYVTFAAGSGSRMKQEPEYHVHFTLARVENGRFNTLDYGYGVRISDMPGKIPLDPGIYMLTTGNRDENGNVLASVSFLELKEGEERQLTIAPRDLPESPMKGGKINLSPSVESFTGEKITLSSIAGKGLVMIWMEPGREPTRHLLNDLPGLKEEFDRWGGWFVFLTDPEKTPGQLTAEAVGGTPENTLFTSDPGLGLLQSLAGTDSRERALPVVLYSNSAGEVLFSSEGYRIGTCQEILKKIRE